MNAFTAPLHGRYNRQFIDRSAPTHIYLGVELERVDEERVDSADEFVSQEAPATGGLGGVFILLPANDVDDTSEMQSLSTPREAVEALLEFSRASAAAGVDAAAILEAATRSLKHAPARVSLPQAEAEFLEQHADIEPESPRTLAQLRAEQAARDATHFIGTDEVASILKIDASRVRHRKGAGILISYKFGKDLRYPTWQFTNDGGLLPGLAELNDAVDPAMHPADVSAIMTTPQEDLMVKGTPTAPCEWLAGGGDPRPVVDLLTNGVEW